MHGLRLLPAPSSFHIVSNYLFSIIHGLAEQRGLASDPYSESTRFKSRPENRLSFTVKLV
jgi:hypothetical protein